MNPSPSSPLDSVDPAANGFPPADNPFFNFLALRRIFNADRKGRGITGQKNRISKGVTITPKTLRIYADQLHIPTGPAGYLSPIVELGLLLMAYLAGAEMEASDVYTRLFTVLKNRDKFSERLLELRNQFLETERLERLQANPEAPKEETPA